MTDIANNIKSLFFGGVRVASRVVERRRSILDVPIQSEKLFSKSTDDTSCKRIARLSDAGIIIFYVVGSTRRSAYTY